MIKQLEHINLLKTLHIKGSPLILFNIWDAGSAIEAAKAGLKAIGTSSWAVARSHGYEDGQQLPFDLVLANVRRIVRVTNFPVTLDIESGYSSTPTDLQNIIIKVVDTGIAGINLEDQDIEKAELYSCNDQCERIKAAREATSIPIFINARTDIFWNTPPENHSEEHLDEALFRASAYEKSGANGFFVPGLRDAKLIKKLCDVSKLPINILLTQNGLMPKKLRELGVSRISYGRLPYSQTMESFNLQAQQALEMNTN